MTAATATADTAAKLGVHPPQTAYEAGMLAGLWDKIIHSGPGAWLAAQARRAGTAARSWWHRGRTFAAPVTSRLGRIASWLRSKIGLPDVLTGFVFALTTRRGRYQLFDSDGALAKAYLFLTWPARHVVGPFFRWSIGRWAWGNSLCNGVSRSNTLIEMWVAKRALQAYTWLHDRHSSWGMRIARNVSFVFLSTALAAMFVPWRGVRIVLIVLDLFVPTSEIVINRETYFDSPVTLVLDGLLGIGSTATEKKTRATRSTKKARGEAKAAAGGSDGVPAGDGVADLEAARQTIAEAQGAPMNREARREQERLAKKVAAGDGNRPRS